MRNKEIILAEQFDDLDQQETAATTGMWVFLATEVIFFGGLFLAYLVFRTTYPHSFAVGSAHTDIMLGTLNTAILLTSSFTMALAVKFAELGNPRPTAFLLAATIAFGLAFLALKGFEYDEHIRDNLFPGHFRKDLGKPVELFFWLYFVMTGLHAIHVFIGIGVLSFLTLLVLGRRFSAEYHTPVKICGLYWHFVDVVWVFLYPLFYLVHK
jgi:cytochrome c oxidase subunit III